eukprot:m.158425 g.158425  ORF g.158425 m.158425 type:complete len:73 (+) comp38738_c0_seq3:1359-1577(+)
MLNQQLMECPFLLTTSVNDVDDLVIGRMSVTLGPVLMEEPFHLCATAVDVLVIGQMNATQNLLLTETVFDFV